MSPRTTTIIGGIGRTLITMGCLTLTFAAFQLWGTGIAEGRAQTSLTSDFEARRDAFAAYAEQSGLTVSQVGGTTTSTTAATPEPVFTDPANDDPVISAETGDGSTSPTTAPPTPVSNEPPVPAETVPEGLLPSKGEALGVIRIPKIGVDKAIIAGTRRADLRKGPGHYGSTPLPGQAGNAAIAGHRTTYGAPFGDLDLLVPGDRIVVETFQGLFNYEVLPQSNGIGHSIVTPYDVGVLDDYGDNRLTLTACHPKYSARQRIVVQAKLVNAPAATVALAGLDDEVAEQLSNEQLAYEATGVDSSTGESDATFDPTIGENDDLAADSDEGNVVGTSAEVLDESLGWHMEELTPFILWSLLTALAAVIALIAARKWRKWTSYLAASPAVLTLLFFCFTHLDRMLPAF